jgi:transaldolase
MWIFVDTADVNEIREAAAMGLLDGVTTNPSLIAKVKRPHDEVIREICGIVSGDVSAEVLSVEMEGMLSEGRRLAKIAPNVVVKIPLIPEGLKAVKRLAAEGIRTNVTLCFSATQGLLAAKAGAYIISPFLGRLDDIGHEGMELIRDLRKIYDNYGFKTKVLAASIRSPLHVRDAALSGADIATIPFDVLKKLFSHPLTDIGLKRFLDDAKKAGMV